MSLTLDQLVAQSGATKSSKMGLDDLVARSRPTAESRAAVTAAQNAPALTPVDKSIKSTVMGGVKSVGQQIKDAAVGSYETAAGGVQKIREGGTVMEGLQAGIDVERGIAGAVFSPLAPITNAIGTLINKAGESISTPLFGENGEAVDYLDPRLEKGLNMFSGLGEIAMAILGAKGGKTAAEKAKSKPAEVPPTSVLVPEGAIPSPIQLKGTHQPWDVPYEPIKPDSALPTIDFGTKAKSTMPTIQMDGGPKGPSTPVPAGMRLVPEKGPVAAAAPTSTLPPLTTVEKPVSRPSASTILKPIEGTGAVKESTLATKVESAAVSRGISDAFEGLPESKTLNMADQSNKALEFITKNPDEAFLVAMGEKAPPKGLAPESIYIALEEKATIAGDDILVSDLVNRSKIPLSSKAMGQRIRILGERDQGSPVQAIKEIQNARAEAIARRGAETPEKVVQRAQTSIRSTHTKQTWGDFVNSITC
jgi:hypothetical protein